MKKQTIIATSVALALTGCTTASMKPVADGVGKVDQEISSSSANMRTGQPIQQESISAVKRVGKVWLPVTKMKSDGAHLNANLNRTIAVNQRFYDINEFTSYLTGLTGISAYVSINTTMNSGVSGAISAPPPTSAPASLPPPPSGAVMGGMGGLPNPALQSQQLLTYSGKLSGLLDVAASRYGLSWEMDGEKIRFFKTKSKTFRIAALPGDTSLESKIDSGSANGSSGSGGSGGGGSSASSSKQNAGVAFSGMSVWKGIEDSVKSMLSSDGRLTVTPATGTLTIDDTPFVLGRVEKFIDEQNTSLSRQVVINVRVLTVDITDSDGYGINWNAVYNDIGKSLGVTIGNSFAAEAGSTNLTLKVLSGNAWDGSSAMVSALSKQGKVSQVTSASLVTINNQPAPIQVGRQTAYLASSMTTIGTGGAGNTVSLTPGQVNTGFSMTMLPHILDSDRLMLQYSGELSSLTRIQTISSGESSIQTPEIDKRNFLQRVIMSSGEMLVVTGFNQFSLNGDTQGFGNAENVALGGGINTKRSKSVIVVLIQPVIAGLAP